MAEDIGDKINPTAQPASVQKKAEASGGTLEEIIGGVKKVANMGAAIGLPLAADRGIGNFNGMGGFGATATSAGLYFGGNDRSSGSAARKSLIGTLFSIFAKYTFEPIGALNPYARAALIPAWQLAANAYYMLTENVIERKKLLIENFWDKYKKINKLAMAILSVPTYLTTFLPTLAQIPALALQAWVFKKFIVGDEKTEPKDKTPYSVAAPSVLGKLVSNTYRIMQETGYSLGMHKMAEKPA
ncbi:hypothetical protein HYT53_01230 [Candidatus Woesearchaeota archaeon]|nr:hypothetical protein [Candidatus Woesearchaeota archaeon]